MLRRALLNVCCKRALLTCHRPLPLQWTWPGMEPSSGAAEMIVRVYAPGGCVEVTVNGVPVAGMAGDGEASGSERSGAAYRRWRRRLQQRRVAPCVNISTSTKWESDYRATFLVPYQPGQLRATIVHPPPLVDAASPLLAASTMGGSTLSVAFRTAGPPVALRLSADRSTLLASRDDLAYVRAELIDAAGEHVQCGVTPAEGVRRGSLAARMGAHRIATEGAPPQRWADDAALGDPQVGQGGQTAAAAAAADIPSWCAPVLVSFAVGGGVGELAAVGNGDPTDLSSFSGDARQTFRGRAYAIVRPGQTGADGRVAPSGTIMVTATAAGLKGASVKLGVSRVL